MDGDLNAQLHPVRFGPDELPAVNPLPGEPQDSRGKASITSERQGGKDRDGSATVPASCPGWVEISRMETAIPAQESRVNESLVVGGSQTIGAAKGARAWIQQNLKRPCSCSCLVYGTRCGCGHVSPRAFDKRQPPGSPRRTCIRIFLCNGREACCFHSDTTLTGSACLVTQR
jgi:hypothetical protein